MAKLAVFLPNGWRGGMLRTVKAFCNMLLELGPEHGGPHQVVLGVLSDIYPKDEFNDFSTLNFQLREIDWELIRKTDLERIANIELPAEGYYIVPRDQGGFDFLDCDAWIFHGLPISGIVAPLRPYMVFSADWIQRVVPQIFWADITDGAWQQNLNLILSTRFADIVYTTSEKTKQDVINYAGVRATKVLCMPIFFDLIPRMENCQIDSSSEYFIWTTNGTAHKNHRRAFESLVLYYKNGGKLCTYITGAQSHVFSPHYKGKKDHSYWQNIREYLAENSIWLTHVKFLGDLSDPQYFSLLKEAKFLWHNVIYDNGTASAMEAAQLGIPTLSSDYPQMRALCEYFSINATFFDHFSVQKTADALKAMEQKSFNNNDSVAFSVPKDHVKKINQLYGNAVLRLLERNDQ